MRAASTAFFNAFLISTFLVIASALYCQSLPTVTPDSTSVGKSQNVAADTTSLRTSTLTFDSTKTKDQPGIFDAVRAWANDNEGFITLLGLLLGLLGIGSVWAIFRFLHLPVERFFARRRYVDFAVRHHQHLPVAGFETNLRIPIPLEKVYVTLRARTPELEYLRDKKGGERTDRSSNERGDDFTVQQALKIALEKKYDGLVILGHPGSGKTTLAKYFLLCFATGKARERLDIGRGFLPILIFLREVDPQRPLVDNILSPLQKHHLELDEKFFMPFLHQGKAVLLFDGLDEVPTEAQRQRISRWIHTEVHSAFPHCPAIVTSRFSGYRGSAVLPGHYLRLEIQDYALPQVKQFIENWLTAVETHLNKDDKYWRNQARLTAGDLYQRIETTPALRELAVNPLMLQIIALVHRDRNTLPERRVELYKECTDVLL